MKKIYLLMLLFVTTISFGQNSISTKKNESKKCEIVDGFKEPKRDKKLKKWMKKLNRWQQQGMPTLEEIKLHVAIDNDCDVSQVILLRLAEQPGNGIYMYCVKGKKIKYRRIGTVITRVEEDIIPKNKRN